MIKILTGWSNQGGSTICNIELCNLFNNNNIPCELYGPHEWHLSKSKYSKHINTFQPNNDDILIVHFMGLKNRLNVKKMIYSCHETHIMPISSINENIYDYIHFVSNSQYKWHNLKPSNKYVIIPNVVKKLKKKDINKKTGIAGIIGSIDRFKQTHISIERALKKGYKKIALFGNITDNEYYEQYVKQYIGDNIKLVGYVDNTEVIYDSIDEVFHSSIRETYNLIKAECYYTGVKYDGLESASTDAQLWKHEDILKTWAKII